MVEQILHKIHLANLPHIREDQVPQGPAIPSKKGIVLIPIYQGGNSDAVKHHVASSACWSRRSWILSSDANECGVEIKLYVEDKVRESALPILRANYISDEDIIWFDGSKIEGSLKNREGYSTFGAKKCASYTDWRFQEYDFIFDVDSDVFVMSNGTQKLPVFKKFFEVAPSDALAAYSCGEAFSPVELHWCRDGFGATTPESIDAWKSRFEELAGKQMLEKYCDPNQSFLDCHGGLNVFPAKHFMTERTEDCEFLVRAARCLCSSQATFSLWHSMGNPIFDIGKTLYSFIPMVVYHQGFPPSRLAYFQERLAKGLPLLFHYAHPDIDYIWRNSIDML